jgi:hypothetical protein
MPYDEEFRKQVLQTIFNLQKSGIIFNRKKYTLEHVLNSYITKILEKNTMFGTVIIERMHNHVLHIFNNINSNTPYEVLDFVNTVIKWYFKTLRIRRDRITLAIIPVPLPDYTIPEIKDLYESMLL